MLTVNLLNVSALSAISANIGDVTAGTITGITITGSYIGGSVVQAGSGSELTLDASGLTINSGTATASLIKWSSGSFIKDAGNVTSIYASSAVVLETNAYGVGVINGNASFERVGAAISLGSSGVPWTEVYIASIGGNGAVGQLLLDHESRLAALENP
jgi:hypothetical protein